MSKVERNETVDFLRGIAAVLMILGHSFIEYPVNISDIPWCAAINHFIYTFHMELFFVVSGYVYDCTQYGNFLKKKVHRILIPYVVFAVPAILLRAYGGAAINGVESVDEGFHKLIFHGGGYWFLYVSFIIFAIYPLAEKMLADARIKLAVLFALLLLDQFASVTSVFMLDSVVHYLPYFILGNYIHENKHLLRWNKFVTGVGAFLIYIVLDFLEMKNIVIIPLLRFVRATSVCVVLYEIVSAMESRGCWKSKVMGKVKSILMDCSRFSLQLYLFNGYLLTAIRILICSIFKVETPVVIVLSIWLGNLAFTLVACKYILPKIPLCARLCGLSRRTV